MQENTITMVSLKLKSGKHVVGAVHCKEKVAVPTRRPILNTVVTQDDSEVTQTKQNAIDSLSHVASTKR